MVVSESATITIDNTPTVSIVASGEDGPIDVHGTVDFKENLTGNEGTIKLYYDAYNDGRYVVFQGQKSFEGADLTNWTWEEITGTVINAGALPQGTHRFQVNAYLPMAWWFLIGHITIDNTPTVRCQRGRWADRCTWNG